MNRCSTHTKKISPGFWGTSWLLRDVPYILVLLLCWSFAGCRDRELQDLENYHKFSTQQANPQLKRFVQTLKPLQHTKDLDKLRTHIQHRMLPALAKYVQLLQSVRINSTALRNIHEPLLRAYRDIEQNLSAFVREVQDETTRMKWVIRLRQQARQFEQQEKAYVRALQALVQQVQQKP